MAATAPTTPPTMAATFAVPLPDVVAAPSEAEVVELGVLEFADGGPVAVEVGAEVLVAMMLDNVVVEGVEYEAIEDSETCVGLLLVENTEPTLVGRVVEVERTEVVLDVVEVTELMEALVWTLGRTLATIGANSPEAWLRTLAHIAAALVCPDRYQRSPLGLLRISTRCLTELPPDTQYAKRASWFDCRAWLSALEEISLDLVAATHAKIEKTPNTVAAKIPRNCRRVLALKEESV